MPRRLLALGLWLAALPLAASELRVCMAESPSLAADVWHAQGLAVPAQAQLDPFFLALLGRRLGWRIHSQVLPWPRCLAEAEAGAWDAVMGISHSPERARWALFPLRKGAPDVERRVRQDRYHWYVRRGSGWDGRRLGEANARLGAVAGYSVVELLRARGLRPREEGRSTLANLRLLQAARLDAAALLASEAEDELARDPELGRQVRRLDPPLLERSYYLAFTRAYASRSRARLDQVWALVPTLRESPALARAQASRHAGG